MDSIIKLYMYKYNLADMEEQKTASELKEIEELPEIKRYRILVNNLESLKEHKELIRQGCPHVYLSLISELETVFHECNDGKCLICGKSIIFPDINKTINIVVPDNTENSHGPSFENKFYDFTQALFLYCILVKEMSTEKSIEVISKFSNELVSSNNFIMSKLNDVEAFKLQLKPNK